MWPDTVVLKMRGEIYLGSYLVVWLCRRSIWNVLHNSICGAEDAALKPSCKSVLQCVAVCCSVLQCAPVCCSVLQCAAVCCSVLQPLIHTPLIHTSWDMPDWVPGHVTLDSEFVRCVTNSQRWHDSFTWDMPVPVTHSYVILRVREMHHQLSSVDMTHLHMGLGYESRLHIRLTCRHLHMGLWCVDKSCPPLTYKISEAHV